jgi:hypothetical protein
MAVLRSRMDVLQNYIEMRVLCRLPHAHDPLSDMKK